METLEAIDRSVFFWINGHHSPFFDQVMHIVSMRSVWIPAYAVLLWLLHRYYGWSGVVSGIVSALVLVLITDTGSNLLFKHRFLRYRPCHNEEIKHLVHLVNGHCGGQFGFISSHSANFFGMAMFFSLVLFRFLKRSWMLLFFCAALVAYSRVYLGVHYPSDVSVAALYGIAAGWLCWQLYCRLLPFFAKLNR